MSDETKFTKGEWVVDFSDDGQITIVTNSGVLPIAEIEVSYYRHIGEFGEYSCSDEQKANAHLIAAAPEMYDYLLHMVEHDVINDSSIEREVKSLLAKARGESQ